MTNPYLRWVRIVFDLPADGREKELTELWKKLSKRKRRFMTHKDEFLEIARYALKEPFSWEGVEADLRESKPRGIQIRNVRLVGKCGEYLVDVAENYAPTPFELERIHGKLYGSLLTEDDTAGMFLGMGIEYLYGKNSPDFDFLNTEYYFMDYFVSPQGKKKVKLISITMEYIKKIIKTNKQSYASRLFITRLKQRGKTIEDLLNEYPQFLKIKFEVDDLIMAIKINRYDIIKNLFSKNKESVMNSVFTPEQVVSVEKEKSLKPKKRLVV